jgi:hypothetical protein
MKKGSGDDPFADLDDEDDDSAVEAEESNAEAGDSAGELGASDAEAGDSGVEPKRLDAETGGPPPSDDTPDSSTKERYTDSAEPGSRDSTEGVTDQTPEKDDVTDRTPEKDDVTDDGEEAMSKAEADGIPWVLRRSRVKEDRENVHQFFLREEYSTREDEIIEAVAGELDMRQKDLQKLDVREAMVAAADPEDIAAVLQEWGYEYLK